MLNTRVSLATPAPSSDVDTPSSPSKRNVKSTETSLPPRARVMTPPPSSPPRVNPFTARQNAPMEIEHARDMSPLKPATSIQMQSRRVECVPPALGVHGGSLIADYTYALVVGRCKDAERANITAIDSSFVGVQPLALVALPPTAVHTSRVHAIIRWVPFTHVWNTRDARSISGTFVLRILGQNGLIVDGKRRRPGSIVRLEPGTTKLDFFGLSFRFEAVPPPVLGRPPLPQNVSAVSPMKQAQHHISTDAWEHQPEASHNLEAISENDHVLMSSAMDVPSSPPRLDVFSVAPPHRGSHVSDAPSVLEPAVSDTRGIDLPNTAGVELSAATKNTADYISTAKAAPKAVGNTPETSLNDVPTVSETRTNAHFSAQPSCDHVEHMSENSCVTGLASMEELSKPVSPTKPRPRAPGPAAMDTENMRQPLAELQNRSRPKGVTPQSLLEHARELVARLAPTYDLAGLLAGAIVFHRTATIAASEAVRSVLSSNPGMLRGEAGARTAAFSPSKRRLVAAGELVGRTPAHGEQILGWNVSDARWPTAARRAWHECLENELQLKPMFGTIQRPGKDTRGNPLECWFYYDKEYDEDRERAQNLGAFVKPMRNAVRSHKPIFWKKSEYSLATSHNEDDKLPYSPRGSNDDERPGKRLRKSLDDDTLDEPEPTWDRQGDLAWQTRGGNGRSKRRQQA